MLISERDQMILSDLQAAKEMRRDFGALIAFYEELFLAQFEFKARHAKRGQAGYLREKEINLRNLTEGMPQVAFHELGLAATPCMELYHRITELLIPYAGCVREPEENQQPEMILEYAREIFLSRGPLVVAGPHVDIIKTACGLLLAPYLQQACEFIMPRIKQSAWHRAYCPVCGGLPSFAALTPGAGLRTFLCSRCNGEWTYSRVGCPFCDSRGSQIYYPSEDGKYRLYACDTCRRYLKTVDMREGRVALSLPVESILTASMDVAAQERGYKPH